jgi:hypothetical protein
MDVSSAPTRRSNELRWARRARTDEMAAFDLKGFSDGVSRWCEFDLEARMPVRDIRRCTRRSLYVALIVGTVLNLINQGDALLGMASINWLKLILTYCVPYAVCTYGAVSYQLKKAGVTLERRA